MSNKRQKVSCSKSAKCLLQYGNKYYVAVHKITGKYCAVGEKAESQNNSAWDCLLWELKEETGITKNIKKSEDQYSIAGHLISMCWQAKCRALNLVMSRLYHCAQER